MRCPVLSAKCVIVANNRNFSVVAFTNTLPLTPQFFSRGDLCALSPPPEATDQTATINDRIRRAPQKCALHKPVHPAVKRAAYAWVG
jgi:hypothetical protein